MTAAAKRGRPAGLASVALAALAICASGCATRASGGASREGKETGMDRKTQVLVMAHRGFRAVAPENTLRAAREAFAAGAAWWELDVAASADGTLVVLHDDNLARTTDAKAVFPGREPWTVYDFTLEELGRLDAGSWYAAADPFKQVAAGRVGKAELDSFAGERIPTLRQCLELTKSAGAGLKVNVEIKDATGRVCDPWIVERTVDLIRELGVVDRALISSFNHDYLRRVKRAEPRLEVGALVEKRPEGLVPLLKELGAKAYHPGMKHLDEATVREVRAAGIDVNVWTVNEPADMERMLSWGVSGLITDFPDRALGLLGGRAAR